MKIKLLNKKDVVKFIPRKQKNSNKNDYGHTLIIGGCKKYLGAGILASLAATRSGAGYIHLMSDLTQFNYLKFPDFIVSNFSINNLKNKKNYSIGFGPGVGLDTNKINILKYLIKNNFEKVVVDADGLTILSKLKIKKLPKTWILTPHEGEMARLINKKINWIKENRIEAIKVAQKKYGCLIILKGAETLLINEKQEILLSKLGRPSLAKAGSGDVLTGIITALNGMSPSPFDSMKLAVVIHSLASIEFEKKNDELSLRPIDLIDLLPVVIKKMRKIN